MNTRSFAIAIVAGALAACRTPRTFSERVEELGPTQVIGATRAFDPAAHAPPDPPGPTRGASLASDVRVLPNGLRVVGLRRAGVPMVTVALVDDVGLDDDEDLALLAAHTWVDQRHFDQEISALAAYWQRTLTPTRMLYYARAPSDSLDGVLATLGGLAEDRETFLLDRPFEAERSTVVGELRRQHAVPQRNALDGLDELLGHGHADLDTRVARLNRLGQDDVRGFLRRWIRPSRAMLVVVGDVEERLVFTLAEKRFGDWKDAQPPGNLPAPPSIITPANGVLVIDHPGDVQTVIAVGALLPVGIGTEERRDATALAAVLGGAMTSRINARGRLRSGESYGASASVSKRRWGTTFHVQSSVETARTGSALLAILDGLKSAREEEATPTEIEMARAAAFGADALSARGLVQWLCKWMDTDEPFDAYVAHTARSAARDPARVRAIAQRYLAPESLRIVLVGDAAAITPQLREISLGPVVVRR